MSIETDEQLVRMSLCSDSNIHAATQGLTHCQLIQRPLQHRQQPKLSSLPVPSNRVMELLSSIVMSVEASTQART